MGLQTRKKYTKPLRLIGYFDVETGITYEFLTDNFKLAAMTIAKIYKSRWQVELFFKWIKQHLKTKQEAIQMMIEHFEVEIKPKNVKEKEYFK